MCSGTTPRPLSSAVGSVGAGSAGGMFTEINGVKYLQGLLLVWRYVCIDRGSVFHNDVSMRLTGSPFDGRLPLNVSADQGYRSFWSLARFSITFSHMFTSLTSAQHMRPFICVGMEAKLIMHY